jgi:hypothetical protein
MHPTTNASDPYVAFDHEACGLLLNREDMNGAVCIVSRGSCFFSQKTLACQRAGAIATVIIDTEYEDEGAEKRVAALNFVNAHPPETLVIPTVVMSLVEGNKLLDRMFHSPAEVRIRAEVYECIPKTHCAMCAPGLTSPETNCTSDACPGMDEAFSRNCSGSGTCASDKTGKLACVCNRGFRGAGCEISEITNVIPAYDGSDTNHHRRYHRADAKTIGAVVGVVCSLIGIVAIYVMIATVVRRRRRGQHAWHIWKPYDDEANNTISPVGTERASSHPSV